MTQTLIFIDITSNLNHTNILNRAIGASEYQFYNLVNILSSKYEITCYNNKSDNVIIDNITYKSYIKDLLNDNIDSDTTIIIQRMFPNQNTEIYNKIKNNKILLWNHDLTDKGVFLFHYNEEEKSNCNDL